MGNTPTTYLGPATDQMVVFPVSITPTIDNMEGDSKMTTIALLQTPPGNATVPVVGTVLPFLLTVLGSIDFADIQNGLRITEVRESISEQDIPKYNAEITGIKGSLSRLNRTGLTMEQIQPEITEMVQRSTYLFHQFKEPTTILYKYPPVTMSYFIRIITLLWSSSELSSKLNPTLNQVDNQLLLRNMSQTVELFAEHFLSWRLNDIEGKYCNGGGGRNQSEPHDQSYYINDRPWRKDGDNWAKNLWNDGFSVNGFRYLSTCESDQSHKHKLVEYASVDQYKHRLRGSYHDYFVRSFFPISFSYTVRANC